MAHRVAITDYLEAGLQAASLRQRAIANNIANLDTPGYRREVVNFSQAIGEAMQAGQEVDPDALAAQIEPPQAPDGGKVNLDTEVGAMVRNTVRYTTYLRVLARLYHEMEIAIDTDQTEQ